MPELLPPAQLPPASLPRMGGGEISLPTGDPLSLVVVFKESCPTCRWALPFVQALHERAGEGVSVVGVAQDDEATTRAFADELGLGFPIALEAEPWPVSDSLGLATVPTWFLADGDGEILVTSPGFSRDDLLDVARRAAQRTGEEPASPFPEDAKIPEFRPG